METTIEESFCYQYLSRFAGLKRSTIECLVANDYDSIHSLMAFDLDIDLKELPKVSMGQKSIIRETLIKLKKEINTWVESQPMKGSIDGNTFLNSTPIVKRNEYPFVSNDHLFKEFVTTAMMDNSVNPSFQTNVSSYTNKQCDNSAINGTHSAIKVSPVKRGRPSTKKCQVIQTSINDKQNSKKIKSLDKNCGQQSGKRKIKRKRKLRYSIQRNSKKGNQKESEGTPLQTEVECETERQVFINIDNEENLNQSIEVSTVGEPVGENRENESIVKTTDLIEKSDINEWKLKKPQILELIKNKSNEIELKRDESLKEMSHFFKGVEVNGIVSPFFVCDLCILSNKYRLFVSASHLKSHLSANRHRTDPSVIQFFSTDSNENIKSEFNDSDSAEELDFIQTKKKTKPKSVRKSLTSKKSLKELAKTSKLKLCIHKMKFTFNESNNSYLANVFDNESHNSSQIVVYNYDQIFKKKSQIPKPYKCVVEGCKFDTAYPFSLDQHKLVGHKKPIKVKTVKTPKTSNSNKRKLSVGLKGMNNYVLNYMKNQNRENSSQMMNESGVSPLLFATPDSKYTSDCLINRTNSENTINDKNIDNNINDKIVTKIKDWLNSKPSHL